MNCAIWFLLLRSSNPELLYGDWTE